MAQIQENQIVKSTTLDPFPTPVLVRRHEDADALNQGLKAAIHRRMKSEPGVARSNRGGWHSETDLADWDEPVVADLLDLFTAMTKEFTRAIMRLPEDSYQFEWEYNTWTVVNRAGDFNIPHCHPSASVSAVYYVQTDPPSAEHPESGLLALQDPRLAISAILPQAMYGHSWYNLVPKAGQMAMWPSWLTHFVHPYQGASERMVIALDARVTSERYDFERIEAFNKTVERIGISKAHSRHLGV